MTLPFIEFPTYVVAGLEMSTLPQQLANGILLGSIYALIALGYTMVYGVLKLINFAHGEVFMLGAYSALFCSWWLGFAPADNPAASSPFNLLLMLLFSMLVCSIVGVVIERFAYRPLRNQPRIASLITAIGLSLLLQYGGQLFLPSAPAPNIDARVNPFQGNVEVPLRPKDASLVKKAEEALADVTESKEAYEAYLAETKADPFNLPDEGRALRSTFREAERDAQEVANQATASGLSIVLPKGQLIMFFTTLFLMAILRHIVLFTKQGRAMRAVSHDFDSAALMGVNVNSIVTFTFILGSALAGAGAMMNATFLSGTKIDTFFGMLPGVKAFVAAVLGGIGNIPGAVLGGLLMGVAETLVVWTGNGAYRDAVAFVILIVVLLFRPGGLLGSAKVEKV